MQYSSKYGMLSAQQHTTQESGLIHTIVLLSPLLTFLSEYTSNYSTYHLWVLAYENKELLAGRDCKLDANK
jgi:hypothetical protein